MTQPEIGAGLGKFWIQSFGFFSLSKENPTFRVPEFRVEVQGAGLGFEVFEVLRFKDPGSS